eukprot:maker-scaffold207_size258870-snap-gene-0.11 protein:Tk01447 transcript:maker-scaffold207_size258870-snap-gene-0.11-mRNA-1 annotation:"heterogeneous nuclear ribonucleoprotein k-like isoform x1"
MKRGSYEGEPPAPGGGPLKRPREDKFEIRVLVPSKVAGSLIGKGGCNIQKLRSENTANVRIPDCPGPERVMSIVVDEPENAVQVLDKSLPYMTEEAVRGGPGATSTPDAPQELRLLIHQSIVGGIIGRAGFKIKEIREASGANVKVYQNCAPQSSDRCVSVSGTMEKLLGALGEIFKIVASTEVKGADQPYDPINYDAFFANDYGGYGSEVDAYEGGAAYGPGLAEPYEGSFNRGGGGGGPPRGGGQPPFGGFGNGMGGAGEGPQETTQVTIPKDMAGAIIGPGGSRIRKIRADSKAIIEIDEPAPGSNERIITIKGTKDQIQTAQYFLQQSVRENANPHPMNPSFGGGMPRY